MNELSTNIFYINLKRRSDRKEKMRKQLHEYGLQGECFEAIETPGFGAMGCCLSHLMVLQIAKDRKYKRVLILEDDFQFIVSPEVFRKNIRNLFLTTYADFDVCMLSYKMVRSAEIQGLTIINKVIEGQTASGYIVQEHYYDTLIELFKNAIPELFSTRMHWIYANDQIWKTLQEKDNWVYFSQRIGKQENGYSDNRQELLINIY
jgi:GR25 family glycosyltransferase involved in LPS biosynthesis